MTPPSYCPTCGATDVRTHVRATRDVDVTIKRLRACLRCGARWTTYEIRAEQFEALRAALEAATEAMRGPEPQRRHHV